MAITNHGYVPENAPYLPTPGIAPYVSPTPEPDFDRCFTPDPRKPQLDFRPDPYGNKPSQSLLDRANAIAHNLRMAHLSIDTTEGIPTFDAPSEASPMGVIGVLEEASKSSAKLLERVRQLENLIERL